MPSLPHDILFHIAHFIPDEIMKDMLEVNSLFLYLALGIRYHDVYFVTFDDRKMRWLRRLRDPALARHVRNVHICPWFTDDAGFMEEELADEMYPDLCNISCTYEQTLEIMFEIVPKLTRTTHFSVESFSILDAKQLQPLFKSAWTAFGSKIQVMSIMAHPNLIRAMELPGCPANALQELDLDIRNEFGEDFTPVLGAPPFPVDDVYPGVYPSLHDTVSQLVRNTTSTLRKLTIASAFQTMDHSPVFHTLPFFPNLTHLSIYLPFNEGFPDSSGLSRFLHMQSNTLHDVRLSPQTHDTELSEGEARCWQEWLKGNLADEAVLANLRSLRISILSSPGVDIIRAYILRSARSLTNLELLEHRLTYTELDKIISPCSYHVLRHLSIRITTLTPKLLSLLAKTFPGLEKLSIDAWRATGDAHVPDGVDATLTTEIEKFAADMPKYRFPEWRLRDFSVMLKRFEMIETGDQIKRLVLAAVPSSELEGIVLSGLK